MQIKYAHTLGVAALKTRFEQMQAQLLKTTLPVKVSQVATEWQGDTMVFSFQAGEGFFKTTLHGTLAVTETEAVLDIDLPMMAKPFEGTMREALQSGWQKHFAA